MAAIPNPITMLPRNACPKRISRRPTTQSAAADARTAARSDAMTVGMS